MNRFIFSLLDGQTSLQINWNLLILNETTSTKIAPEIEGEANKIYIYSAVY